jgi:hypothetical protein
MKKSVFFLVLLFTTLAAIGQVRPRCYTCKDAEFAMDLQNVIHTRPKEVVITEVMDTVVYVWKPAHQVCKVDAATGKICTVEVPAERHFSSVKMQRIITVEYVPVEEAEPVLRQKYEAEMRETDCD